MYVFAGFGLSYKKRSDDTVQKQENNKCSFLFSNHLAVQTEQNFPYRYLPQALNAIKEDVYENDDPDVQEDDSQGNQGGEQSQLIQDFGQNQIPSYQSDIHVITVIGQVEGHLVMPPQNKTTKYEHIIPQLVAVEESPEIKGLLIILNTVGGDVEAGLAMAEMMSSMSKPVVSLVLGGGHSIGVPIAVAADYSFIAPTATMTIHPIRLTGMVVGVQQSFDYMERIQDRVIGFITSHSKISEKELRHYMMNTGELARDIGTIVVGQGAVESGLIDEIGGLHDALKKLREMITEREKNSDVEESVTE